MEFLRKLLIQTQSHLRGLTLSQRLAIGSCVALIALSLLWLVNWAARPELVPLLDQPLSAEELARIEQQLGALEVPYEVAGSVVKVPAQRRARLLAQLGQQRLLPDDISIGFAKLLEENSSPWLSAEEQGRRWSLALGNELSRVLCEFDGVRSARVFIDKNIRRTIGQSPVSPTASVFVKLAQGARPDRDFVFAVASFVSRSVAGLDVSNVGVTDATTGRSYTVPSPEEGMAFDDLEDRQKKEEYFGNKIRSLLANIPGLLVAVHAALDPESRHTTSETFGKPFPAKEKTESTVERSGSPAGEPGVVANVSRGVPAGLPTSSTETEKSETTNEGGVDKTVVVSESPRHGIKHLSASVNVPRSYLAAIYRQAHNGQEPTDAQLPTTDEGELGKIKRQVMRALDISEEDKSSVTVDWFHDGAMMALGASAEASGEEGMMSLVRTYGGKAGMGALAVVSLFMMLMMVRRVGEGPVLPGEEPPKTRVIRLKGDRGPAAGEEELEPMEVAVPPVGEARQTEQLLVGKEVDERTLRTQQVVDQVSDMVRGDTDAAVSILRRWIDEGKH